MDAATPSARCDPNQPFGTLTRLDVFNPLRQPSPRLTLSGDELTVVVTEQGELRSSRRPDRDADFPQPTNQPFANLNQGIALDLPSITSDALDVYLTGDEGFLSHASRPDLDSLFANGAFVKVNGRTQIPGGLQISSDRQTLFRIDLNDNKLHAATQVDSATFTADAVISTMTLAQPVISADGLRLYYVSGNQIFATTRTTLQRQFEPGTAVAEVNADSTRAAPLAVTADDCELYFSSDRSGPAGKTDVWRARRGL